MITHIVLFKLKEKTSENLEKTKNILMDMKGKIAELKYIEVGQDITHSERSYDIALYTKFETREDLEAYQINPLHVEVADYMVSVRESSIVVDYESP